MKRVRLIVIMFMVCVGTVSTQAQLRDPVDGRLNDICKLISGIPIRMDSVFAESFMQKVSASQLLDVVAQINQTTGMCTGTKIVSKQGPFAAKAEAMTKNGYSVPILINVASTYPFRIEGLYLQTPVRTGGSLESVVEGFKELKGLTSLHIVNLNNDDVVASYNAEMVLPIGSAFKLYVLGELVRSIADGEHAWHEVVNLDSSLYSLPSGTLHTWPNGSPITLHSLATLMISVSDNTATDALINVLNPNKVEAIQSRMGHRTPGRNSPFLSTSDLFRLKYYDRGSLGSKYARSNRPTRLDMLNGEVRTKSLDSINLVATPVLVDSVEWFATTKDMVQAMSWLKKQNEKPCCTPIGGILAVNAGLDIDVDMFPYVGYKGGSEPGVMNMTYLLKRKDGTWFALSASWLRKDADVDATRFAADVAHAIRLLSL